MEMNKIDNLCDNLYEIGRTPQKTLDSHNEGEMDSLLNELSNKLVSGNELHPTEKYFLILAFGYKIDDIIIRSEEPKNYSPFDDPSWESFNITERAYQIINHIYNATSNPENNLQLYVQLDEALKKIISVYKKSKNL